MRTSHSIPQDDVHRPRLRVHALFWMTVASVLLSGIAVGLSLWIPRLQHQRLVDRVEQMGGVVYAEPAHPYDVSRWLSGRGRRILAVDLSAADMKDDDLSVLTEFSGIRRLLIAGPELTDSGVEQLKQLEHLESLVLVDCPQITKQAEQTLFAELPQLRIDRRGPALLGIVGGRSYRGCRIHQVRPGSAAAKAGLYRRDVITRFDGKDVRSFGELTRLIAAHQPGDRVEIVAYRRGRRMNVFAVLGAWKEVSSRN